MKRKCPTCGGKMIFNKTAWLCAVPVESCLALRPAFNLPMLPVRIYPGRVHIDGSPIDTCDLARTLKEVYRGFRFNVVFRCGFASREEIGRVERMLGCRKS